MMFGIALAGASGSPAPMSRIGTFSRAGSDADFASLVICGTPSASLPRRSRYMLRRYCPPTSNSAWVI